MTHPQKMILNTTYANTRKKAKDKRRKLNFEMKTKEGNSALKN